MRSLQKGSFNIGREGDHGSAQCGRSVIYNSLIVFVECKMQYLQWRFNS